MTELEPFPSVAGGPDDRVRLVNSNGRSEIRGTELLPRYLWSDFKITAGYFINAENLLNVRQTREEPLLRPTRAASGQWTTDIWSRNDGFIINGGVRLKF